MKAWIVLVIHTVIFVLFVSITLIFTYIGIQHPAVFSGYGLLIPACFALAVTSSWKIFGGCPITVWENELREREKRGSGYAGPCIDHYARAWFGLRLPSGLSGGVLVILLILPLIAALIW